MEKKTAIPLLLRLVFLTAALIQQNCTKLEKQNGPSQTSFDQRSPTNNTHCPLTTVELLESPEAIFRC